MIETSIWVALTIFTAVVAYGGGNIDDYALFSLVMYLYRELDLFKGKHHEYQSQ